MKEAISQKEYQLIEKISQSLIGEFNSNQKSDRELLIYLEKILEKAINLENWQLCKTISQLISQNFNFERKYDIKFMIRYQYIRQLKSEIHKLLEQLIEKNKYTLATKTITILQNDLNYAKEGLSIISEIDRIIREQLEIEDNYEIKPEDSFYNDLDCDELDFVELMMAVEEEFDLEISDEIQEQTDTVEKLYDIVLSSS